MSRRRRRNHEEHQNHEAWAIPYADLMTLLLAFFVVMYAISTVNEGKYRVLSDALVAAFRGTPRTMEPIEVGKKQVGSGADVKTTLVEQSMLAGEPRKLFDPVPVKTGIPHPARPLEAGDFDQRQQAAAHALERVADQVIRAMQSLERANLVFVRRKSNMVEVEIRTDILYPSGSATLSPRAIPIIDRLAGVLRPFPNPIRVEGHTDSRPIDTIAFPSNWELSAARAASVVRLFQRQGIDPARLAVMGYGQYRPAQSNATQQGRNANRRVVIVILAPDGTAPEGVAIQPTGSSEPVATTQPPATTEPATPTQPPATTEPATPTQPAATKEPATPTQPAASSPPVTPSPPAVRNDRRADGTVSAP